MSKHPSKKIALAAIFAAAIVFGPGEASGAKFTRAEVTKTVNEVTLLISSGTAVPATRGTIVRGSTAVRTGQRSRAELQFPDKSVVRLGSNSVFSFLHGTREVNLERGSLLMQVPKSLGRTKIKTAAVSAAITGTTILVEYIPATRLRPASIKIIVIEGSLEFSFNDDPDNTITLLAGEMVAFRTNAGGVLPQKFEIDLERLTKTSLLINGGMGELPLLQPIDDALVEQGTKKRRGRLLAIGGARELRERVFSRLFPRGGIDRRSTVINGRPPPLPPPPPVVRRNNTNPGIRPGTSTTPGAGITLPDRPDREPPGTPPNAESGL